MSKNTRCSLCGKPTKKLPKNAVVMGGIEVYLCELCLRAHARRDSYIAEVDEDGKVEKVRGHIRDVYESVAGAVRDNPDEFHRFGVLSILESGANLLGNDIRYERARQEQAMREQAMREQAKREFQMRMFASAFGLAPPPQQMFAPPPPQQMFTPQPRDTPQPSIYVFNHNGVFGSGLPPYF